MKRKMKKIFYKLMCIASVCLLTPITVQAAQNTARIPNNPIDISSVEVSYDLRDERGNTVWPENGSIEYTGEPLKITAYPEKSNRLFPRESYSVSIEGNNVKKELVKEGYTELTNIYNDHAYGFQDENDNGTILRCSLLPVYQVSKRLGMEREHVSPFYITFMDICDTYTLEELRNYSSMADFVNKTGYMQSDSIYEGFSPGYVTNFENTALDKAKQWGYEDIDSYVAYLCAKEEYAKCEVVKETWYPVYFMVSKNLVSREAVEAVVEEHNYTLFETDSLYYIHGTYTRDYAYYMEYNTRMEAPKLAKELNVNSDQVDYSYKAEIRDVYHTYYSFTDKQLIQAMVDEMDTWSGRWDYFLYGDEHFNYGYDSEDITRPGYYFGNWGAGFGVIQDQIPVVYEPEYKYTITGPGRVTIKITGREDQNGHGSANLQGIGTIYLNVTSKENGEWMHNARGWWYQNADGTYPVNQWKDISGSWYYFDINGYMYEQGWHWIDGKCYYMYVNGAMAVDTWIDDYYVNESGAWVQEKWMHNARGWWYQNADGTYPINQWKYISKNWYYFDTEGYMCGQGWQNIGGNWYYFASNGAMQTGWVLENNIWYYMSVNGQMLTGWQIVGDDWYYFDGSGAMAVDAWIGGYYVNSNGAWVH